MLRTRFYNMRRPPKLHAMGLKVSDSKPPKRLKKDTGNHYVCIDLSVSSTDQDKTIFERNKMAIKKVKSTDETSQTARFLMKETLALRHKWIKEEFPIVKEILREFPLLQNYIHVSTLATLLIVIVSKFTAFVRIVAFNINASRSGNSIRPGMGGVAAKNYKVCQH